MNDPQDLTTREDRLIVRLNSGLIRLNGALEVSILNNRNEGAGKLEVETVEPSRIDKLFE